MTTDTTHSDLAVASFLATAMQLNGARARNGDILAALELLGLRLVSDGHVAGRLEAAVEATGCGCGSTWARLRDAEGPGAGWWHQEEDGTSFTRKCPHGEHRIREA